jgi:hypothetical protein
MMANTMTGVEAARLRTKALARWEGEGGALGHAQEQGEPLDDLELRILTRLGAGVLGEWSRLPTDTQRAIFQRASTPRVPGDGARLKSDIARFLHDHKDE